MTAFESLAFAVWCMAFIAAGFVFIGWLLVKRMERAHGPGAWPRGSMPEAAPALLQNWAQRNPAVVEQLRRDTRERLLEHLRHTDILLWNAMGRLQPPTETQ